VAKKTAYVWDFLDGFESSVLRNALSVSGLHGHVRLITEMMLFLV
jgi:hypothetical protein